jgi:cell division protein FtsI/penicillin-binding protein 2
VAQTIGNGGVRMQPRLVQKVIDPDGRTVETPLPKEAERVMSEESAQKVIEKLEFFGYLWPREAQENTEYNWSST